VYENKCSSCGKIDYFCPMTCIGREIKLFAQKIYIKEMIRKEVKRYNDNERFLTLYPSYK
jgi:Na+-translocating ferredoxin:NAD+ oxidoreductase RnfC subunit